MSLTLLAFESQKGMKFILWTISYVTSSIYSNKNLCIETTTREFLDLHLLIKNIDVVITANNAGFEIADVFVTHDLAHLVIRKLVELHAKFFLENATKLHDFRRVETTFWFHCRSSCVHESIGDCQKLHLDLMICPCCTRWFDENGMMFKWILSVFICEK